MNVIQRLLRFAALSTILVTFSSCCCCDPDILAEYAGDSLETKFQEEAARVQAEIEQAQVKQAETEAKMKETAANMKEQAVQAKDQAAVATENAKAAKEHFDTLQDAAKKRDGAFKSTPFQKENLTSGNLKLEVAGTKVSGKFLGQYYLKPFSIPVAGKLSPDGTFELKGDKDKDTKLVIRGTHNGDELDGKVNGLLRGKAIDAKFNMVRQ